MNFTPRIGLWRHPEFLKLWAGQTVSKFGSRLDVLGYVAILTLGATPFQMGVLASVELAPVLAIGLLAGVWVDRLRRRPVMIVADLGRFLLLTSVPLAVALGHLGLAQLIVVATLVGVLTVFFDVAYGAFLPHVVRRENVLEANSRLALSSSTAEITGPGIAGVLVQLLSAPVTVMVDAGTFLVSAIVLGSIRSPEARPSGQDRRSAWHEGVEGMREVFAHPILRSFAAKSAIENFFGSFFGALYALYLIRVLGIGPAGVGVTIGAGGIGETAGVLLAAPLARRFGLGPTVIGVAGLAVFTTALIPLAGGPLLVAMCVILASQLVGDAGFAIYAIHEGTTRQILTPGRLLGRVTATMSFVGDGVRPVGLLAGGILGQSIGIRSTLWIAAGGHLLAFLWLLFSPVRRFNELPLQVE